jgi:hypothetical protein
MPQKFLPGAVNAEPDGALRAYRRFFVLQTPLKRLSKQGKVK